MSNVEMRCPRCGSSATLKNKATSEYECTHCTSTFRFVDPTHKTVLHGSISHNCPACGAPVKDNEGYLCTECGRDWLCLRCAKKLNDKYVCADCLKEKYIVTGSQKTCPKCNSVLKLILQYSRWYCYTCGQYTTHVCPDCGSVMTYAAKYADFYCYKCGAYPSRKQRANTATCPSCRESLAYIYQYQRLYCYNCRRYV
jgi:predicted RNA-binding Zn-ribbon protein involved in translation (DUF1610 family)